MKTFSILIVLFFWISASFAQMEYEKGYLITNDLQRKNCLIKNEEWKDNPVEFSYKLTDNSAPETGTIKTIKEFGIDNTCKYVNAYVKIDLQTKHDVGAKNEVIPKWSKERLFLKVLVEGKATLFSYDLGKVNRYLYALNDTNIIQLTYLEAYVKENLIRNTSYQQQLWGNVKAPMATMNSIKEIGYNAKDLSKYFKEYNSDFGGTTTDLAETKRKPYFNLKLSPGFNMASLSMSTVVGSQNQRSVSDFGSKAGFQIGTEAELILPFNKYHWGILFEPTFQSYSGTDPNGTHGESTINYQSIEFPIGIRYYFPLSDNTRIFLDGLVIPAMSINMNSSISYYTFYSNMISEKTIDINPAGNSALGAGAEFKKFSIEARYYTTRNLLDNSTEYADYNRFAIIVGYKFIKTRFK